MPPGGSTSCTLCVAKGGSIKRWRNNPVWTIVLIDSCVPTFNNDIFFFIDVYNEALCYAVIVFIRGGSDIIITREVCRIAVAFVTTIIKSGIIFLVYLMRISNSHVSVGTDIYNLRISGKDFVQIASVGIVITSVRANY